MASYDKGAHLPKADDFERRDLTPAVPRPALYSLAVSLSAPPPPPPPPPPSASPATAAAPSSSSALPSILDPEHFPSLGPTHQPSQAGVWTRRPGSGAAGALELEATDPGPQQPAPPSTTAAHPGQQGLIRVEWLDLPTKQATIARQGLTRQSSSGVSDTTAHAPPSPTVSSGLLNLPVGSVHLYRHAPASENHNTSTGALSSSSSIFTTAEVKLDAEAGATGSSSTLLAVSPRLLL